MRSCAAEGEKYSRILLPVFLFMFAENRELLVLSKRGLLERL